MQIYILNSITKVIPQFEKDLQDSSSRRKGPEALNRKPYVNLREYFRRTLGYSLLVQYLRGTKG